MTLWRAMPRARRPISIGGGDAVDAVDGDHRVGGLGGDRRPGAAHRDADVGEGKGGSVVDAVADHDDRGELGVGAHRADDLELLLGALFGEDLVEPGLARAIRSATARAVAGHHRDSPDAGPRSSPASSRASSRRRSAITTTAGEAAVDPDQRPWPGPPRRRPRRPTPRPRLVAARAQPGGAADGDPAALRAFPPCPARAPPTASAGSASFRPAPLRLVHKRLGEHVGGELVERGGQAEDLLLAALAVERRRTRSTAGLPSVSVPVLSSSTVRASPSRSIAARP